MDLDPSSSADGELIARAREIIARLYGPDRHVVGAAGRASSGAIYAAVHLEATVGRVAVYAEAIALGKAISEGETVFDTIVAVRRSDDAPDSFPVVSPCGMCRELISDYGPGTNVIYPDGGCLRKRPVLGLLPATYGR